jgi:hypothetical protein
MSSPLCSKNKLCVDSSYLVSSVPTRYRSEMRWGRLIIYIQHLLHINVALFFYHLCIHFYTPVMMKINPVGYTPLPSNVHTLTGLDVPAQWNV